MYDVAREAPCPRCSPDHRDRGPPGLRAPQPRAVGDRAGEPDANRSHPQHAASGRHRGATGRRLLLDGRRRGMPSRIRPIRRVASCPPTAAHVACRSAARAARQRSSHFATNTALPWPAFASAFPSPMIPAGACSPATPPRPGRNGALSELARQWGGPRLRTGSGRATPPTASMTCSFPHPSATGYGRRHTSTSGPAFRPGSPCNQCTRVRPVGARGSVVIVHPLNLANWSVWVFCPFPS